MKKTFLFIRKSMGIGGIETYLVNTIKQLKKTKNRIIWISPKGGFVDSTFKKHLFDDRIEIYSPDFHNRNWNRNLDISFQENESVFGYSSNLYDFIFLEKIKRKYNGKISMDNFFWVPHFQGGVFLENFFPKKLRPLFRRYFGKVLKLMEKNNNIIYLNNSHLIAFTERYGIKVDEPEKKVLHFKNNEKKTFDELSRGKMASRDKLNIITITRFIFPHKAYLLGLISVFGKLKRKYSNIYLTIIGYGKDLAKVSEEIEKLELFIRKDINLIGKVAYDDLSDYFREAHVNIGVAGALRIGARNGVLSIPVRHYSEKCEGYGYLPQSKNMTNSKIPGKPIELYIEEIMNMSDEEYYNLCRDSYDTYKNDDPEKAVEELLTKENKKKYKTLPIFHVNCITNMYYIAQYIRKRK